MKLSASLNSRGRGRDLTHDLFVRNDFEMNELLTVISASSYILESGTGHLLLREESRPSPSSMCRRDGQTLRGGTEKFQEWDTFLPISQSCVSPAPSHMAPKIIFPKLCSSFKTLPKGRLLEARGSKSQRGSFYVGGFGPCAFLASVAPAVLGDSWLVSAFVFTRCLCSIMSDLISDSTCV